MTTFAGPLRTARAEVLPHIPELAPQLRDNPYRILEALEDTFTNNGHDIAAVPDIDWNKTERHTIAGFVIREQAAHAVEGEGAEARFRDFRPARRGPRNAKAFKKAVLAAQDRSAEHVQDSFSHGPDAEHGWWKRAARRYWTLGFAAMRATSRGPSVPIEGVFLRRAMRTVALNSAVRGHFKVVGEPPAGMLKPERQQSMHDLSHLTTSLATLHFLELTRSTLTVPDMTVVYNDDTERYQAEFADRAAARNMFQRIANLPTVRLKCPAHIRPERPAGSDRVPFTPLQNMFHAAVNAAIEYEYDLSEPK